MNESKKALRKLYGITGEPLVCNRLLGRELDHDFGTPSFALMVIDDTAGTVTGANVYGGNVGRNYDPEAYRHALPEAGADSWKKWKKRGYTDFTPRIAEFPCLLNANIAVEEIPAEETPAEEDAPAEPKLTRAEKAAAKKAAATK